MYVSTLATNIYIFNIESYIHGFLNTGHRRRLIWLLDTDMRLIWLMVSINQINRIFFHIIDNPTRDQFFNSSRYSTRMSWKINANVSCEWTVAYHVLKALQPIMSLVKWRDLEQFSQRVWMQRNFDHRRIESSSFLSVDNDYTSRPTS